MSGESSSQAIDAMFAGLDDWRGAILSRLRRLIKEADPEVLEDLKWKKPSNPAGVPVWSDHGIICTGELYQAHVKVTFARGALLEDPRGLFNASLGGNLRRAIDIYKGSEVDRAAFIGLVREAVQLNKADARHG